MRPTLPQAIRARLLERADACRDPALRRLLQRAARPRPVASSAAPASAAPGTLLDVREVSDRLRVLRLAKPEGFQFVPGQHVRIRTAGISRPYTLVSAPHEPFLEIFVQRAEDGELTPHLWRLAPGDRVDLAERAKGGFALDARFSRHLMIATASGIAPFVSMLRHALHAVEEGHTSAAPAGGRAERGTIHVFHVLHGVRHQDDLGYAEELSGMPRERVRYYPTVSQPDDPRNRGWTGAAGRVERHIEPTLRAHDMRPDDTAVYACGNPGMITQVEALIGERGFTVHSEPF